MANISKKVEERVKGELKKYQKVLESAKARDINESDTVIIVNDILSDVMGYDKYSEITTELLIRGTFCDIAVKVDEKVQFLIEVKAIGLELKDSHIRQAVGYATREGIDWVVLTNGVIWQVYKLTFGKPVEYEMVFDFDFLNISHKEQADLEKIYLLSKEGLAKSAIEEFQLLQQAVNRFTIAAMIQSDAVTDVIHREIRKIHKGLKIDKAQIAEIIRNEVIKRDILQDDKTSKEEKLITKKHLKKEKKVDENKKLNDVAAKESGGTTTNVIKENIKPGLEN